MAKSGKRARRSDATQNRERLLAAAREVFAEQGHDAPLEDVARAASVSRTTLYRNFATREELAAAVFEENVTRIEERSAELRERQHGVIELFDFVLDMLVRNRALTQVFSVAEVDWFTQLSARTVSAFEPLLEEARRAGLVHPEVGVEQVMIAFPMAAGAMADNDAVGREAMTDIIRTMLHRALFTQA